MRRSDESRIAELLSVLAPAPEAWVRAAQELPLARRELDGPVLPATNAGERTGAPRAAPPDRRRTRF
jgi:hypothetical protein